MSQPGETIDFRASDHVMALRDHAGGELLDCVVVNTGRIAPAIRRRYAEERALPVENDLEALRALGVEVVERNLLQKGAHVRHNPAATGAVALELAMKGKARRG
jgi:2-phospho-L-lactate transferase/gluconeogenesis factor (CofD/UPF0052 family)